MVGGPVRTPLFQASSDIFLKCDFLHPGRSHKARVARALIADGEASRRLAPGTGRVLLERTGGNLGIALALEARSRGYDLTLVTDPHYSATKKRLAAQLGAHVIDRGVSFPDCANNAEVIDLMLAEPGTRYYYLNQFANPANPRAHETGTGAEILSELVARGFDRRTTVVLVTGMGTGASMRGVSAALGTWFGRVITVAVQPPNCDLLAGVYGEHAIQGIAVGEPPPFVDVSRLDAVVPVTPAQVAAAQTQLIHDYGFLVGPSSAANVAAVPLAREHPACAGERCIFVTLLFDRGEDYL